MATLTELIRQEDPKRPYADEQLAQMLQLRREPDVAAAPRTGSGAAADQRHS